MISKGADVNAMDIKGNKSSFIIVVCKKISLLEKSIDKEVATKLSMSLAAQHGRNNRV